jgi:hypothetical protein
LVIGAEIGETMPDEDGAIQDQLDDLIDSLLSGGAKIDVTRVPTKEF